MTTLRVAPRPDGTVGMQVVYDDGLVKEVENDEDLSHLAPGYYDENGVLVRSLNDESVPFGVERGKDWNPFQPREPAGSPLGGEWTSGSGSGSKGLQEAHKGAIRQYTANDYFPVNQALRNGEELSKIHSHVVEKLDEAFDKHPVMAEPQILYRAAGEPFAKVADTLQVGNDVVDPGYVSTTSDLNYASTLLTGQAGEQKVLLEIVAPKGSKYIDTTPFNPFKGENESLLPRNSTFRYLGKEQGRYRFRVNPAPRA